MHRGDQAAANAVLHQLSSASSGKSPIRNVQITMTLLAESKVSRKCLRLAHNIIELPKQKPDRNSGFSAGVQIGYELFSSLLFIWKTRGALEGEPVSFSWQSTYVDGGDSFLPAEVGWRFTINGRTSVEEKPKNGRPFRYPERIILRGLSILLVARLPINQISSRV